MDPREKEAAQLARCVAVARSTGQQTLSQQDANVFAFAASALRSEFPHEAKNLRQASDAYFAAHPDELLPLDEVLRRGWIIDLPRLRNRLTRLLKTQSTI